MQQDLFPVSDREWMELLLHSLGLGNCKIMGSRNFSVESQTTKKEMAIP